MAKFKIGNRQVKVGKDTSAYVGALLPENNLIGKIARTHAKLKRQDEIDAFHSHTSHNGNVNDND